MPHGLVNICPAKCGKKEPFFETLFVLILFREGAHTGKKRGKKARDRNKNTLSSTTFGEDLKYYKKIQGMP